MPDRLWPALWTSLDVPGVEPTDNVAERAIRPTLLWRKGSFGTQSGSGARFAGAMLTGRGDLPDARTGPVRPA